MLCIIHHRSKDHILVENIDKHIEFAHQLGTTICVIEDSYLINRGVEWVCHRKGVLYGNTGVEIRNPSYSRNLALKWSSDDSVIMLDTEVVPEEDLTYFNVLRIIAAHPLSIIRFSVLWEEEDGTFGERLPSADPRSLAEIEPRYFYGAAFYANRSVIDLDCYHDIDFVGWGYEDNDFVFRCGLRGIEVLRYNGAKFRHRYHGKNDMMAGDAARNRKLMEKNKKRHLQAFSSSREFSISTGDLTRNPLH